MGLHPKVVVALAGLLLVFATPARAQDAPPVQAPPAEAKPMVPVPPLTDPRFRSFDYLQTTTGSVLWGRLESAEQGSVLFDILALDEMTVKVKNVSVLIARSTRFQIDVKGHPRIIGRIDAGDRLSVVSVWDDTQRIDTALSEIIYVKRIEQTFFNRLDGNVSAGYSFTSASGIGRFNFAQVVTHSTTRTEAIEYYSLAMTLGDQAPGVDRIDGGVGGNLIFNGRYLAAQYIQYQKIVSTGLDSRWVSITGGGYRFVHGRYADIAVLSGVTFTREKPIGGTEGDLQTEVPLILAGKFGGPDPKFLVTTTASEFKSLTVTNRYRTEVRMNAMYEIIKHSTYGTVTLGSEVLYSIDTKPPDGGPRTRDLNVSFNVGYSF